MPLTTLYSEYAWEGYFSDGRHLGPGKLVHSKAESTWKALIVVMAVGAAGLYGCLVVYTSSPGLASPLGTWVERTVVIAGSLTPPQPACSTISSGVYSDRFCLSLTYAAAGEVLNGSFDHGAGTPVAVIYLAEGPLCVSGCPSVASWFSPDGTGKLTWNFTTSVTISVLD